MSFRLSPASIRAAIVRVFGGRAATPAVPSAVPPALAADPRSEATAAATAVPSMPDREVTPGPEPEPEPIAPAAVIVAPDPDAERLLARCAQLEEQMVELRRRRADMEQQVRSYEQHQYAVLGEVVGECLRLRQAYLRLKAERSGRAADAERARQADEDFDAYRRSTAHTAAPLPELDEDEQDELRRLYRAAAMRCHPDRAAESERAAAHDIFLRVQAAYQARDLEGLRGLAAELAGWAQSAPGAVAAGPGTLKAPAGGGIRRRVGELQHKVADLILAVQTLQLDPVYRKARQVEHWDTHFADARASFEAECEALRAGIAGLASRSA